MYGCGSTVSTSITALKDMLKKFLHCNMLCNEQIPMTLQGTITCNITALSNYSKEKLYNVALLKFVIENY